MEEQMPRLSIDDLKKIKDEHKAEFTLREGGYRAKITVHMGTCGITAGARDVMTTLVDELSSQNIKDVVVTTSGCAGLCSREPMATVEVLGEAPVKYVDLNPDKIKKIITDHILGGNIVEDYAYVVGSETSY
jgi:NADP-reducing hydrogenase subunit HndB